MPDSRVQSAIDHWAPRFVQGGVDFNDFQRTVAKVERWDEWLDPEVRDPDAVRALVTEGPERLAQLIAWGAAFDREATGRLLLTREGGHSADRIVHAGGDATGSEVQRALQDAVRADPGVTLVEHAMVLDLVTDAAGRATRIGYDGNGTPTRVEEPGGRVTTTAYDALDRPVAVKIMAPAVHGTLGEVGVELVRTEARRRELQEDLGDALANAGRGSQAASAYLDGARSAPPLLGPLAEAAGETVDVHCSSRVPDVHVELLRRSAMMDAALAYNKEALRTVREPKPWPKVLSSAANRSSGVGCSKRCASA